MSDKAPNEHDNAAKYPSEEEASTHVRITRKEVGIRKEKNANFNACSATRGSTFSVFVKLNQSYENISFVVHHRAGDGRVFQLLSVTEERGDCGDDHDNHSRRGQENDRESEDDSEGEDDTEADGEEEGCGGRISFSFCFAFCDPVSER